MAGNDRGGITESLSDKHSHPFTEITGGRLLSAALYFIVLIILISFLDISLPPNLVGQCLLRSLTGFYCPGCGGTTAVRDILHGRPFKSFCDNPAVLYTLYLLWLYTASFIVSKVSCGRFSAVKVRPWHFYVLVALILISWIIKNIILLLTWGAE